jgi:hypothetical protein
MHVAKLEAETKRRLGKNKLAETKDPDKIMLLFRIWWTITMH